MTKQKRDTPLWIDLLAQVLESRHDQVLAVRSEQAAGEGWTGAEFTRRIGGAAASLDAAGCRPGAAVPALITTSPESLALVVAGSVTGRPLAPFSPRLTVRELIDSVEGLESPVVICEPEWADIGRAVTQRCGRALAVIDEIPASASIPDLTAEPGATAYVLHTSGTTGRPRRVDVRQDRMGARALVHGRLMRLEPGSVFSVGSPFHHIGGFGNIAVGMARGARIVTFRQFSVQAWGGLAAHGVTHAQSVPTIIEMLLRENALAIPTLKLLQYGGSPIHPDTLRRAMAAMPEVAFVNLFGQTEGSPLTCLTPEDHARAAAGDERLLRSVGRPVDEIALRIHEPDAAGNGEVWARGDHLLAPDADGWLRTGDLGHVDDRGYVVLAGRQGDMIIRGGENVHPLEVEQVLAGHQDVVEAAVIGVPDARLGEAVKAFIVPRDPAARPDTTALRAFARASLAGFKVPEDWEFVAELPRNPNGKVLRRALR